MFLMGLWAHGPWALRAHGVRPPARPLVRPKCGNQVLPSRSIARAADRESENRPMGGGLQTSLFCAALVRAIKVKHAYLATIQSGQSGTTINSPEILFPD